MIRKVIVMTLLTAVTTVMLTACESMKPSSLSGAQPVMNDKGRIVDYR